MPKLILTLLAGLTIGAHLNLWSHPDFRARAIATLQQIGAAGPYIARAVSAPWRGYDDGYHVGFRDGLAAGVSRREPDGRIALRP